jgi:hypothetical protein
LRFTGNDDYNLKTAFIGELSVTRVVDGDGKVIDLFVDFNQSNNDNIREFLEEVMFCVESNLPNIDRSVRDALRSGDVTPINSLVINCSIQLPVNGNSSSISFDVGNTIVKPILSSLVNYYFSILRGTPLDNTSAKWVNFIASMDSHIVRAIKIAALAGTSGDSSVVGYLGSIISGSLVDMVASRYMAELVAEGCSELNRVLTVLPRELKQIIPARNTDSKSAGTQPLLDAIKNEILSHRDNVSRICSDKTNFAYQNSYNVENRIYTQNREGLIKLAETLEEKLVKNLESRGLGTLARYVRVEQ